MKFLADENVDRVIVERLRNDNHVVLYGQHRQSHHIKTVPIIDVLIVHEETLFELSALLFLPLI